MKKYLIIALVLLVLVVGGFFILKVKNTSNKVVSTGFEKQPIVESQQVGSVTPLQTPDPNAPVKEFTVNGSNFEFNPGTITVNKGDTVKINFIDEDGTHNLVIDGYNLSTNVIGSGAQDSITFVADKVGTFEYFCSVSNHRDLGMTGQLIVK